MRELLVRDCEDWIEFFCKSCDWENWRLRVRTEVLRRSDRRAGSGYLGDLASNLFIQLSNNLSTLSKNSPGENGF